MDDRWGALDFRADVDPVGPPSVEVVGLDGAVIDGAVAEVRLAGLIPGERVVVRQCISTPGWPVDAQNHWEGIFCDDARPVKLTADGVESVGLTVFHDIRAWAEGSDAEGWSRCEPCALVVSGEQRRQPLAVVPVEIVATDRAIRPTVAFDGATSPGGAVGVEISGLQPGQPVTMTWCLGVAEGGGAGRCEEGLAQPVEGVASAEGAWRVERIHLPTPSDVVSWSACDDTGPGCGLGLLADGVHVEPFVYVPIT